MKLLPAIAGSGVTLNDRLTDMAKGESIIDRNAIVQSFGLPLPQYRSRGSGLARVSRTCGLAKPAGATAGWGAREKRKARLSANLQHLPGVDSGSLRQRLHLPPARRASMFTFT